MANTRFDTSDRPSGKDVRFWCFRKHYPTGLKKTDTVLVQCTACQKTYGRHGSKLPHVDKNGKFEPCSNYIFGRRCMCEEYDVMQIIEVEAMPIGNVRLPRKGREW